MKLSILYTERTSFHHLSQATGSGSTYHPRGTWLGLTPGERIINVSAAGIRVSVLTDSGRIATFLDESIGKNLIF